MNLSSNLRLESEFEKLLGGAGVASGKRHQRDLAPAGDRGGQVQRQIGIEGERDAVVTGKSRRGDFDSLAGHTIIEMRAESGDQVAGLESSLGGCA